MLNWLSGEFVEDLKENLALRLFIADELGLSGIELDIIGILGSKPALLLALPQIAYLGLFLADYVCLT